MHFKWWLLLVGNLITGMKIFLPYYCMLSKTAGRWVLCWCWPPIKLVEGQECALQWDCVLNLSDVANFSFLISVFPLSFFHIWVSVIPKLISATNIFCTSCLEKKKKGNPKEVVVRVSLHFRYSTGPLNTSLVITPEVSLHMYRPYTHISINTIITTNKSIKKYFNQNYKGHFLKVCPSG